MAGQGYYAAAVTLPTLIDKIANELIATGAGWSDGDASWNSGKRCIKYTGSETMYVALEMINTTNGVDLYVSSATFNGKGLKITLSDNWSGGAPSGNTQDTFIQFEACYGSGTARYVTGNLTTMLISYYLWIDNNGFVVMGVPEPNTADNRQGSFIAVIERMVTKEYTDSSGNFYGYFRCNYYEICTTITGQTTYDGRRTWTCLRPFRYKTHPYRTFYPVADNQDISPDSNGSYNEIHKSWDATYFGHKYDPCGIEFAKLAIKSSGNGKVYFTKPIIHNSIYLSGFKHETAFDPIGLADLFIAWRPDSGLVDGDVIALPSPSTVKYILKSLNSPDSATPLYYGIKYNA
ncbi:hypothetical protein METP3_02189 [Methanosarcinales archaeon]|nr:hypothetical protein METP3_02189 [Methanosarcinales archaeon]